MTNGLLLLAVSLAWASDYLFIGWADRELPPIAVAAATTSIAALVLLVYVRLLRGKRLLPTLRQKPGVPLVMAVTAVAAPKLSVVVAENRISADLASLVGTTVPILTLLTAIFVTHQTPYSHGRIAGMAIALFGMMVFVGLDDAVALEGQIIGMLIMMSGGVAFAFNGLYSDRRAAGLDAEVLTVWVLLFGGLGLSVATLLFEAGQVTWPTASGLASLAGSGVVSMGLAYLGYYALIARTGASFTSLYAYLVPPLGLLSGVLFLDHPLTGEHLAGVALTLAGLWLITGREGAAAKSS